MFFFHIGAALEAILDVIAGVIVIITVVLATAAAAAVAAAVPAPYVYLPNDRCNYIISRLLHEHTYITYIYLNQATWPIQKHTQKDRQRRQTDIQNRRINSEDNRLQKYTLPAYKPKLLRSL